MKECPELKNEEKKDINGCMSIKVFVRFSFSFFNDFESLFSWIGIHGSVFCYRTCFWSEIDPLGSLWLTGPSAEGKVYQEVNKLFAFWEFLILEGCQLD